MEHVARENRKQPIVDRELDEARLAVYGSHTVVTGFTLQAIRNMRDREPASRQRVLVAVPDERLGCGEQRALVIGLVHFAPRLGDDAALVVRERENAGYEFADAGRKGCTRPG